MRQWIASILIIVLCLIIGFLAIANYSIPDDQTAGPTSFE